MPDFRNHSPAAWQTLVFASCTDFTELSPAFWRVRPSPGINANNRQPPPTSVYLGRLLDSVRTGCGGDPRSSTAELSGWPSHGRPPAHKIRLQCLLLSPFP